MILIQCDLDFLVDELLDDKWTKNITLILLPHILSGVLIFQFLEISKSWLEYAKISASRLNLTIKPVRDSL